MNLSWDFNTHVFNTSTLTIRGILTGLRCRLTSSFFWHRSHTSRWSTQSRIFVETAVSHLLPVVSKRWLARLIIFSCWVVISLTRTTCFLICHQAPRPNFWHVFFEHFDVTGFLTIWIIYLKTVTLKFVLYFICCFQ